MKTLISFYFSQFLSDKNNIGIIRKLQLSRIYFSYWNKNAMQSYAQNQRIPSRISISGYIAIILCDLYAHSAENLLKLVSKKSCAILSVQNPL